MVANRTYERAEALAGRLSGKAIHYDRFPDELQNTDIVISSTASPIHVVTQQMVQPVLRKRRGRPLIFIDIAVPRDIEPSVGELPNVFRYDIDDLHAVLDDIGKDRQSEISSVEAIVEEEVKKFFDWKSSLEAVPIVTLLREKHETIRQSELTRLRNQLPDLTDRQWQCIEAATRSMINRIAKDPVEKIKGAALSDSQNAMVLDAAKHIFALEITETAQVTETRTESVFTDVPEEREAI